MKITVSVTIQADDDAPAVVSDVFTLNRDHLAPDTIGLSRAPFPQDSKSVIGGKGPLPLIE